MKLCIISTNCGKGECLVAEQFVSFLKRQEKVLICWTKNSDLGRTIEKAVIDRDGIPVFWGEDHRWSTLLRRAFTDRCSVIVGDPVLILGLSKLAKQNQTPLYVRNVVLTSECPRWMRDGIAGGLDCRVAEGALTNKSFGEDISEDLRPLRDELLKWFSILDCRMHKGESGLEMELITFPGKKLPLLPSCAKQVVRYWDPDRDCPFLQESLL